MPIVPSTELGRIVLVAYVYIAPSIANDVRQSKRTRGHSRKHPYHPHRGNAKIEQTFTDLVDL
jgi:hypothetical protein